MAGKWVDNTEYFGPDRRRRPGKRLMDRRRYDEAGELPPAGALPRRLRVRLGGATAEARRHAIEMLKGAIYEASRLGWRETAAALQAADHLLRSGATPAAIDAKIVEAMDHAGANR